MTRKVYAQIVPIDKEPKPITFSPTVTFGNNCWLMLQRYGVDILISGNRLELANHLENIIRVLRGGQ